MKKLSFALALLIAAVAGKPASAALTFTNSIVNGFNTYQDQSFDLIADNGDGVFSVGDVLYGFAVLDDRTFPPSGGLVVDSTYMVFSQQVSAIGVPTILGTTVSFAPTTVAGLTLSSLTGGASTDPGAIFAIFEKPAGFGDLINNGAGVPANIATIIGGSFTASAGFGTATSEADDFFTAVVINPGAFTLATVLSNGEQVGSFTAGLTILEQPGLPSVIFNELVVAINPGSAGSLHELSISEGGISGVGNAPTSPSPYSYGDQLKATIHATVIPEPTSMLAWMGLACCSLLVVRRRRKSA